MEILGKRKDELIEGTEDIKSTISYNFEELRKRINNKESSLLRQADSFIEDKLKGIDSSIRKCEETLKQIQTVSDVLINNIQNQEEVNPLFVEF